MKTIATDVNRFKQIVRGRVRKELGRYIQSGEITGGKDGRPFSVPIKGIDLPHFRFKPDGGGVGMGDGEVGDGQNSGQASGQAGGAGNQPGKRELEAEFTREELADLLGEELALPRIQPKGKAGSTETQRYRYTDIAPVGPRSLRSFRRTFRRALQRQIASGDYNPAQPSVVPIKGDERFRSSKPQPQPEVRAVVIYIIDVSGSMGLEQKEMARLTAFWTDLWLQRHYPKIERCYITHDGTAQEVKEDEFYRRKSMGGTLISSPYLLLLRLIKERYPPAEWNIYVFQFSDGDNHTDFDTKLCITLLRQEILPDVNLFCYGQTESEYGSGAFLKWLQLQPNLASDPRIVLQSIPKREAIMTVIKMFLSRGS